MKHPHRYCRVIVSCVLAAAPALVSAQAYPVKPRPVAEKLNQAPAAAIRDPESRKILIQRGADPIGSSIDEHDAFIKSEIPKWIRMARAAGIDPQ